MPAFCVADCPDCRARFRLVWRIGKRRLKLTQRIRLNCPTCGGQFTATPIDLVVFYTGAYHFPSESVVDDSSLVA
jgi:C4-type Zn-finger protein